MDADPRPAYSRRARPLASGLLLLAAALAGCFVVQPGASSALRAALANEPRRDAPVLPGTPYPYAASAESVAARLSGRAPGGIGNRGGRGGGGRGGRGGFGNARDNTPDSNAVTDAGATLGRVLFYDRRLSANDQIERARFERDGVAHPARWRVRPEQWSIRTVPVNHSAGPFADGRDPLRLIFIELSPRFWMVPHAAFARRLILDRTASASGRRNEVRGGRLATHHVNAA